MLTRRPPNGHEGREAGFTLVELLVAMTVLMLVLGSLLSALESLTKSQATTSSRIDDEQTLRLTLAQLTRDLRDANQLRAASPTSADFLLDGSPQPEVRWTYDPSAHSLTRSVVSGTAPPAVSLLHVTSATFGWIDPAGLDLGSQAWATSADLVHCAVEVRVSLTLAPHWGVAPATQTVQAGLRNQGPLGGCG